jgi:hypothetical protein
MDLTTEMPLGALTHPLQKAAGRGVYAYGVLRGAGKVSAQCRPRAAQCLHSASQCWQSVRALNYAELCKYADNANNPNAFRINVN